MQLPKTNNSLVVINNHAWQLGVTFKSNAWIFSFFLITVTRQKKLSFNISVEWFVLVNRINLALKEKICFEKHNSEWQSNDDLGN